METAAHTTLECLAYEQHLVDQGKENSRVGTIAVAASQIGNGTVCATAALQGEGQAGGGKGEGADIEADVDSKMSSASSQAAAAAAATAVHRFLDACGGIVYGLFFFLPSLYISYICGI